MPTREMYVVLVREKGMFLVEPVPGLSQREAIERTLGMGGGYSAGLVPTDVPDGADEAWACWVEGQDAGGRPYFTFRAFPAALTEADVLARLEERSEEPVKMNLTPVYWARRTRSAVEAEPPVQEFLP
ncbi:MAG TPA: hypothetical protein VD969_15015 [Symbiobacteriaceae bacterium]|nr:hypothetical protein [Symbiobacteriaceae bacterium]